MIDIEASTGKWVACRWAKRKIMRGTVPSDRELLDCFVRERDSAAFRNLVVRHGPAVLQVCRGVLQDPHEAEDAFQATFLVLVRKAPSIEDPEALGGWLRGVAYRTAVRSRSSAWRRRVIERAVADMSPGENSRQELAPELRQMIREELDRLPDSYRQPLILCYLEGLTHLEAASRLGWPVGTVKTRLVRGRRLMRERLDRRGAGLGAGLLLWLLNPSRAAAVPQSLLESTVRVMTLGAGGRRAALESKFAGAFRMAEATPGSAIGLKVHLLWPALALTAILLGFTGSTALGVHRRPMPEVDPTTLPSNLTDVLNVDCS
jgi:RNA polymerase sigma factor (sigma-70 family)